jgi:pimeloyl-ACP methyl ester carboxylesterase
VGTILDHESIMRSLNHRHGGFEALVAHSLGVPFALYAVRQGLQIRRVVTINGICDFGYLVDRFSAELHLSPSIEARLRRAIEFRLFAGDRDIWRRFSATGPIDCDLLVVQDDDDPIVVQEQADKLLAASPGRGRSVRTHGWGHSRSLTSPDVRDAIVDFLGPARR